MAYVVTQNCCNDATCVAVCPVDCIHPTPEEREYASAEMLYIDPGACIDCGACAEVCPVDAIVPDDMLSAEQRRYPEINLEYFAHGSRPPAEDPRMPSLPILSGGAREARTLRVAIVGSGPAACYAAEELLTRSDIAARVTMLERLPVAGGLVRFGVAPDHWRTRDVGRVFDRTARRDGFALYLGVDVGVDITVSELLAHHHAVVYASGASGDRRLGIEGERLPGSHAAREFVAWYNGHPDHASRVFDLSGPRAVVVGNGNVALDVARMLVSGPETLSRTDIADHALTTLTDSAVEEVIVLGRRGAEHAAWTTPELLALGSLPGIDVCVDGAVAAGDSAKLRILSEYAARRITPGNKRIVLRFGCTPLEIVGADRVEGIRVTDATADAEELIDCGLVLRAIGYRGEPVADLPYDEASGTVTNLAGRVVGGHGPIPGVYVAGWIKRGATGVIGTNRYCAAESVARLVDDFHDGLLAEPEPAPDLFRGLLRSRRPEMLDASDWRAIDRYERAAGWAAGRPRVKVVDPAVAREIARAARA
ncbi:FAD-dependent oxidoreductase [Nocardia bovistercoris]|uniref:ferredoxin--NADP(+) reductase n=1 Tax=Nocardia bovistercoris TaxID=2785916 RepID=A0A931IIN9_9NOCA|nr:FAD-dependent oxidoreductase [Nocardia bovistercoris]MBH0781050.1 FAD-dependent oxidoreductase [Nocardia bovistercoris]